MKLSREDAKKYGIDVPAKRSKPVKYRVVKDAVPSTVTRQRWVVYVEDWHPPRCNQWVGRHWSVKNRLKNEMIDVLSVQAHLDGIKIPDAAGRRKLELEIILGPRQHRPPDADAYDKLFKDALVWLLWLGDDSDKWLEYTRPVFTRGPKKATRITLEDLA